jgi:hypothetical protein
VHAFEPALANAQAIERNIRLNQFDQATIHQSLLSQTSNQEVYFHYSEQDSGNSYAVLYPDDKNLHFHKLQTSTLDEKLDGIEKIKLIKIDVEGFEVNVLKGAKRLLEENRVEYWIVENAMHCLSRNGESLDSLRSYMSQFNLDMFVLDYEGGFPKLYPKYVMLGGQVLNNLLFTRIEHLGKDWVWDDTTYLSSPRKSLLSVSGKYPIEVSDYPFNT